MTEIDYIALARSYRFDARQFARLAKAHPFHWRTSEWQDESRAYYAAARGAINQERMRRRREARAIR